MSTDSTALPRAGATIRVAAILARLDDLDRAMADGDSRNAGKLTAVVIAHDVPALLEALAERDAEIATLRAELEQARRLASTCTCYDGNPANYEGAHADCPIHGAIRAFNEVSANVSDCVWVSPQRLGGKPCIGGTRISADTVARYVWCDGVDPVRVAFPGLIRAQTLIACWYVVRYGLAVWGWADRWGTWADEHEQALWSGRWDEVPDPPSEGGETTCGTCHGTGWIRQEGQIGVPGSGCIHGCPDCDTGRGRLAAGELLDDAYITDPADEKASE